MSQNGGGFNGGSDMGRRFAALAAWGFHTPKPPWDIYANVKGLM